MSRDPAIDAYIAKAQPFARPILSHVRERVHAVVPSVKETTKWGMPSFTLNDHILLMPAAFKAHAALNFWRGQELRGNKANGDAMGQFGRLKSLADLPPDKELDRLIREAAELARSAPATRKAKHAPKPPPASATMWPCPSSVANGCPTTATFAPRSPRKTSSRPPASLTPSSKTITVDQKKAPTVEKAFVSLGTFTFEKGKAGFVEITNKDVNGFVIADAVVFVPVE